MLPVEVATATTNGKVYVQQVAQHNGSVLMLHTMALRLTAGLYHSRLWL